jgi:hypothetical protein
MPTDNDRIGGRRYCSHCGAEMLCIKRGAEENMIYTWDSEGGTSRPFDTAYNRETGERNYCFYYKCAMYRDRRWYQVCSPHDEYFIDKTFN